jgi:hypothetical protein
MKIVPFFLGVGLLAGCASPPRYDEVAAKAVFKDAIVPLPTDCLLGAPSLPERDAICESVARAFVSDTHQATEFIGFKSYDSDGVKYYDPSSELLKRLRSINSHLKPVSDLRPLSDTERDGFWRQPVPAYYLFGMNVLSVHEAEVYVEVVPVFIKPHGTFFICRVKRQDGK